MSSDIMICFAYRNPAEKDHSKFELVVLTLSATKFLQLQLRYNGILNGVVGHCLATLVDAIGRYGKLDFLLAPDHFLGCVFTGVGGLEETIISFGAGGRMPTQDVMMQWLKDNPKRLLQYRLEGSNINATLH